MSGVTQHVGSWAGVKIGIVSLLIRDLRPNLVARRAYHRARPPRTLFGLVNADCVPVTIRTTGPRDSMRTPLSIGLPGPCAKRSRTELAPPSATQSSDGCRADNPTCQRKNVPFLRLAHLV